MTKRPSPATPTHVTLSKALRQAKILGGINTIFRQVLAAETEERLGEVCLAVAEQITDSQFGFIGELNAGRLDSIAISDPGRDACRVPAASARRRAPTEFEISGLYGRVVQSGSLYTNAPASHPDSVGTPPGHPPLKAFLGVPLRHEGKTIGLIAVGNRAGGYTREHVHDLEALAPAIVEAFFRKRAEMALRENQERLATFAAATFEAIIESEAGRILDCNEQLAEMTGYAMAELRGMALVDLLAPEDRERASAAIRMNRFGVGEFTALRKDGTRFTVETHGRPVAPGRRHTAVRNITARKQAEERVRASEALLRAVTDNSPDAIYAKDAASRWILANPAVLRIVGRTADEALGKTDLELYADAAIGRAILENDRRILEGGQPATFEEVADTPDGRKTFLSIKAPRRDAAGHVVGVVGISHDITDRKRAEEAVKESEARFRSVLDGSRDVIYRVNVGTGRFEYISPSCAALVGFSAGELMALDTAASLEMIHPDDRPGAVAAIARVMATGAERVEYRQRTRSGEYRWMSNHMSLVRDADGRPLYRDGNIRDVTEQKQLETALQQTVAELEHANRVKDEFLATLSHELRTPLNAILGWSQMLLRSGLAEASRTRALESISRNAQAQASLIDDILDVSRIITGKLRLDPRPLDLRDVVKAACESVLPAAQAKGVDLRTQIETDVVVIGDADRLQQVVWNLLSNAVKFTGHGGRVEVKVSRVGSQVHIAVRDSGDGIAPDFLPHVFERFRQADASTTRRHSGLGLGLALVKSLTELHGGRVAAESGGEGKGATFTIMLPLPTVPDDGRAAGRPRGIEAAAAEPIAASALNGLRVVVVDDQEEARVLVEAVLERAGARVTACATAEAAFAAIEREPPDLLVADIGMPQADGYWLIRRLRESPDPRLQTVPAIAFTAYGGAHDRAKALSAGFSQHLAKPIVPDALVKAVALAVRPPSPA